MATIQPAKKYFPGQVSDKVLALQGDFKIDVDAKLDKSLSDLRTLMNKGIRGRFACF